MRDCTGEPETSDFQRAVSAIPFGVPIATPVQEGVLPNPVDPPPYAQDPLIVPQMPNLPRFCRGELHDGCYAVTIRPRGALRSLQGTVRVDSRAPDAGSDELIISGDLYRGSMLNAASILAEPAFKLGVGGDGGSDNPKSIASLVSSPSMGKLAWLLRQIPIYPRRSYDSYLSGTGYAFLRDPSSPFCRLTIDFDQFDYSHPSPATTHQGSFPRNRSRWIRLILQQTASDSRSFAGTYIVNGRTQGTVKFEWVSSYMRRAVLEIDTLTGAVAPQPVPNLTGTGNEYFDTVFARAGWRLEVIQDDVNIPVPAGVTATNCWSDSNLHALMLSVRQASTNLDTEWRTHLVVVPAQLGCSRGVMYDLLGDPREGSASFSDDGYPVGESSNFGTATNALQRNVPRAFLRSAIHEVTHAFNQIHQEIETTADNSIMTTTPNVANVLDGPNTGETGVFPDQIRLRMNSVVRNHLAHMPDPVVRPGGWPFRGASLYGGPQANDHSYFSANELALDVAVETDRVALGQPVNVTWAMENKTDQDLLAPNDVSLRGLFASMKVVDDHGNTTEVRPFVISCDSVRIERLAPKEHRSATCQVFWSTAGFAFGRPGRHIVTITVAWSAGGVLVATEGSVSIWVDYPLDRGEADDAALVMDPEVGKWVALGGGAYHLAGAVDRLMELNRTAGNRDGETSRVLQSFNDLLPDPRQIDADVASSPKTAGESRKGKPKRR